MTRSSKLTAQLASSAGNFFDTSYRIRKTEKERFVISNETLRMPNIQAERLMAKKNQSDQSSSDILQQISNRESQIEDGMVRGGVTVGQFSLLLRRDSQNIQHQFTGRNLNIYFEGIEWDELFFDVLCCPTRESVPDVPGEDSLAWEARYEEAFKSSIPQYPMLARIWDMYVDASYSSKELEQLRNECLNVKATTKELLALSGLNKLIQACDEGLKERLGLYLAAD